jgi:hypothetical protein
MKVELNIPTNLSEITLSAFQKYLKISEGQQDDNFFLKHKAIEIFCGVPLLTVSNMRQIDVNDINEKIAIVLEQKPRLQQTFNLDGLNFGFIPNLEDMTAGEYIDLDTYIQNMDTMHKALAVLYRPIKTKLKDKYLIEDYEGSDKYSSIMKDVSLEVAFGASVFFLGFRKRIVEQFDTLFTSTSAGNTDYSRQAQFGQKWGWYNSIYAASRGDVTKYDDITKLNVFTFLTFLSFEKEKNEIEIEMINKSNR